MNWYVLAVLNLVFFHQKYFNSNMVSFSMESHKCCFPEPELGPDQDQTYLDKTKTFGRPL